MNFVKECPQGQIKFCAALIFKRHKESWEQLQVSNFKFEWCKVSFDLRLHPGTEFHL